MADYTKLIDAETWAFIERTNSWYPPDTIDFTIAEQRAVYEKLCHAFFAGYPKTVTAQTTRIDTPSHSIPIRIYRREKPDPAAIVLYCHGGGYILGGLASHDDLCAELCEATGYELISVDYRLAPEHLHPAAFGDAVRAFEWAAATYRQPIVLCGDSAGGNLAAAVSHATRGHARTPIGQVLIYPSLGGDMDQGSYVTYAEAPMLTMRDERFYREVRRAVGGPIDPTTHPLVDSDFSRLPPTVIVTAECDPVSSDGETYRDRILAAGGRAWWSEEPGMVHSFLRGRHMIGRARAGFTRIVDAVGALGKGQWPY